jgi:hypothetical protein
MADKNHTTKEEERRRQREYRKNNGNIVTKRYEKTKNGFLMRLYRNMTSRFAGIQKQKHHLYEGKTLMPKEQFYEWAKSSDKFHSLFAIWEDSGYDRKLTPSVDRIDSSRGYEFDNIEWVTHSENSRRGSKAALKKRWGK